MIVFAHVARSMIGSGNARATGLVHHTTRLGDEITLMSFDNFELQRTDHYKVADGHISADQLDACDAAALAR